MRGLLTAITALAGVVLALVAYLLMAAPLGIAEDESFSNPRVPFAATFFVIGIALVFISAIVYEVLPEEQ